jgi:hypothetical protein
MPRVEALGPEVDKFCEESGNGSSTHDVCLDCYADLLIDPHAHDEELKTYNGEPDGAPSHGWAGDVVHPPYEDLAEEGNPYYCEVCNRELKARDNGEGL